jgi:tetrahydromethanopterin S-methyltransferase subunit G
VEEHSRGFGELREMVFHLDQKVDRVRDELARRIEALDERVSRQFTWMVGIQVTILLAVIGTLLAK